MSSEVQIAVIDQQDTQIVLAVPGVQGATGSEIAAGGTANQVLRKASSTNYDTNWSLVTNAMVDSSAAIAGTKISPNFGSQNVVTTGTSTAASFIPTSNTAPTNGLYLPAANNVAISTNGTQKIVVDANGKVGIGGNGIGNGLGVYLQNGGGSSVHFYEASDGTKTMIAGADSGQDFVKIGSLSNHPIGLVTGNGEKLRITTDGKVGLGTTSPEANFQINHTSTAPSLTSFAGSAATFRGSSTIRLSFGTYPDPNFTSWIQSADATGAAYPLLLQPLGGRVGIGTTSPGAALDVVGGTAGSLNAPAIFVENNKFLTWKNTTGTWAAGAYATSGNDFLLAAANNLTFGSGSSATERARIDSSGRLLVGTSISTGSALLQVRNDGGGVCYDALRAVDTAAGAPVFRLNKSRGTAASPTEVSSGDVLGYIAFAGYDGAAFADAAYITAIADGTWTDGGDTTDNPGALVFSTTADGASSPTERARINSSGTFRATTDGTYSNIDATAHGFRQTLDGNWVLDIVHTGATTPFGINLEYSGAAPNGTGSYFYVGRDTGGTRFEVRSNGGIASYSANNVNLSDRNVKKDIAPAAGTWGCLKEWEIVNFRYKDQPDDADLNMGVIAQQVAESCPEVITVFQEATEDQPEKLGVKDQQMMWMAIKALQEAQLRIETLEAKVAALEAQ